MLLGRRLRSDEREGQKIGPLAGIPVLGLDALASASYGPEAALTVLLPLGVLAPHYVGPLIVVIIALLSVVYLSYRQTIAAYPNGGGSYTVASQNLSAGPGLVAASALAVDYILNVAVAISAGTGAIISAFPVLQPYTLPLCLVLLVLITTVNLRGVRESGLLWMIPTYLFVATLGLTMAAGVVKVLMAGGHPVPVRPPPVPGAPVLGAASLWLLGHAFASGCTAMTGVEAVSNGVPVFREPRTVMARRTLTAIIAILVMLLAGIAFLSNAYGIAATRPGTAGYESVLSQLIGAVWGRGTMYFVTLGSVVAVLALSTNTSFADFPRLCRVLALDDYLPAEFAHLGRRLVYSQGIVILAVLAAALLVAFGGVTDRLIPLFAVGAFLAFTLSQAGMVVHWHRAKAARGRRRSLVVNAVGAAATGATLIVVVVAKFTDGAWLAVLVVPALVYLFSRIHHLNKAIDHEVDVDGPLQLDDPPPPVIVVPLKRLDRVGRKALRLAASMSPDVHVLHVLTQEPNLDPLRARWRDYVERPFAESGIAPPKLVEIPSAYREFFDPVLKYVHALARENPRRYVAVFVPELVERRWYHFLLHSHRATLLKGMLLLRGGPQVVIINAPWHLRDPDPGPEPTRPGPPPVWGTPEPPARATAVPDANRRRFPARG